MFLILRTINNIHPFSLITITFISRITTIYARISANWEQDIKKIIALSTLRQIAIIIFAISIKSVTLAFFHLIIHALFKSTIFLCAGIIIHNSSYQDIRIIGINIIRIPSTLSIIGLSSTALIGVPFISGFFSKDSIIEFILQSRTNYIISTLIIISIGLTASYSTRIITTSNKILIKSKRENIIHTNKYAFTCTTLIAPLSILSGTIIIWIYSPSQIFILPRNLKIRILLTLTLGIITGISLHFKRKTFKKIGTPSITLWFTHIITTILFIKTSKQIFLTLINDNSWQEIYGPQGIYNINSKSTKTISIIISSSIFIIIIITLIPIIIYLRSLFRAIYWR